MNIKAITYSVVTSLLLFAACRKSDKIAADNSTDNCVVQQSTSSGTIIDGQYIIAYRESTNVNLSTTARTASFTNTLLQRNNISSTALRQTFTGATGGFIARLSNTELQRLKLDTTISFIEQDRIIAFGTCFQVVEPKTITWNVARVGYGDGTGKTAWIIDSGIDFNHPDLNADATRSKSFINGVTSAADENGHGTHVAGIIGAKNNSIGVLGVASGASLVALRVFNKDGEGTLSSIVQALSYVNSNGKAGDVVNLSLGEDEISAILDQQVQNTAAKGIYVAIAAGNDRKPAVEFSPGRANGANIYTVSAVDSLDNFASFSNYGNDCVDFAAPGVRITSTYLNGKYAIFSGTSMAAPHVAGLLLLKGKSITSSGKALNDPDGTADPIAHK
ncbi:S8 family peptidase [Niastella caeni]|uniref:S8 family peptidase n=1 Tax=Niastella caeni TaxID=2569763 RepID=A0A4S8HSA7_9BACT|nr:S8 family serine peptidase [Niastella caeni]THU36854.1 S8 family peptidase [Niastella caeni]